MKALFCHDHYYYSDGNKILSKGQYANTIWQRYLVHFDGLTVIGRNGGSGNAQEKNINISSAPNVTFQLFKNINSIRGILFGRKTIKNDIANLVAAHDVVILRGTSELGSIAFDEAKRQRKFIVMEAVSCAWDELWYYGTLKAKLYAPFRFFKQRYLTRNANATFYVSRQFLQNRYPSNSPLIAAVSDVVVTQNDFYRRPTRPESQLKIGMIGTLKNKLKGVHIAIEACNILKSRNIKNFTFHVLGPGNIEPWQDKVNAMGLKDYIVFDGIRKSGQPVLEWLRDLDIYIQPSFQEGLPRAVVEAMAQSLPVIGSDAGGIPELIDKEWVFKRGQTKVLANLIEKMMHDKNIMVSQGQKNYRTAQGYIYENLDMKWNDFWQNVKIMAAQNLPR